MNRLTTAIAAFAALTLAPGLLTASVAAEPGAAQERRTAIRLEKLERGPDASVPYVANKFIVDGITTTRVPGQLLTLFGTRSDGRYLVRVWRRAEVDWRPGHSEWRVVTPGGSSRRILRDLYRSSDLTLSDDGTTLAVSRNKGHSPGRTRLRVLDAVTLELLHERVVRGFREVLDVDAGTVLLARRDRPAVSSWDLTSGAADRISRSYGLTADLETDRLAAFTEDPNQGGCNVVSTVSEPGTTLSRSCRQAAAEFSTDGSHVAMVDPDVFYGGSIEFRDVRVRTVDGREVGHYRSATGFHIRDLFFEDADTLLLEVNTSQHAGLVRCVDGACELAGDLRDSGRYD